MFSTMARSSTPLRRSLSSPPRRPAEIIHYDFVEMSIGALVIVGDDCIVGILIARHPHCDGPVLLLQRHLRATTLTQATASPESWLREVAVFRQALRIAGRPVPGCQVHAVSASRAACGPGNSVRSDDTSHRPPPPSASCTPYEPWAMPAHAGRWSSPSPVIGYCVRKGAFRRLCLARSTTVVRGAAVSVAAK